MVYFDIFVCGVIGFALISGLFKGLVRQIGSLGGLVLGIIGTYLFTPFTETWLIGLFDVPATVSHPLAYLVTFLAIYLVSRIAAYFCLRVVRWGQLGLADRIAGALFSVFKYILLLSILINIYQLLDRESRWISQSKKENTYFYTHIVKVAPAVFALATGGK